ncbi:hypothetical protein O0L34_g16597 [Tuta absoluta]|nr:hypothetical protein O0L34_g16597 [Tuta absoluta]
MKLEGALTELTVNKRMLSIDYACRGPILDRAEQIEREIEKGVPKPFERVIRANIGDPHALGQKPITFLRQVVGLCACPDLLPTAEVPSDVKKRVQEILADCSSGSVGSYSPYTGLRLVRSDAARYLTARDGVPACPHDIILGSGATDLIKSVLELFVHDVDGKPTGVMIPIPQYPLFSSALTELGLQQVNYLLNESNNWSVCLHELRRAWSQASNACHVRAIVVINPGNPTAQVLSRANMEEIIQFAYENNLFVFADEVYQENIISKPFHSFKKVKTEMGEPYSRLEMASFMTASKGWAAECGLRGALMELQGVQPAVRTALLKSRGVMQCPNILGQIAL